MRKEHHKAFQENQKLNPGKPKDSFSEMVELMENTTDSKISNDLNKVSKEVPLCDASKLSVSSQAPPIRPLVPTGFVSSVVDKSSTLKSNVSAGALQVTTPYRVSGILQHFLSSLRINCNIGNKVEKLCDRCNITVNKNAVFGDSSALAPGGVQIGTRAMTSRGLLEKDFEQIGEFFKEHGKLLKDFNKGLVNNKEIEQLKADVEKFASSFDMPGFKMSELKYKS